MEGPFFKGLAWSARTIFHTICQEFGLIDETFGRREHCILYLNDRAFMDKEIGFGL